MKVDFIPIENRSFFDMPYIECYGKNVEEIMEDIFSILKKFDPTDKVLRINMNHILPHQYRSLDFRAIRSRCQGCLHYEINPIIEKKDQVIKDYHGKIDSLTKEYSIFIKEQQLTNKDLLLKKGLKYIQNISKKEDI